MISLKSSWKAAANNQSLNIQLITCPVLIRPYPFITFLDLNYNDRLSREKLKTRVIVTASRHLFAQSEWSVFNYYKLFVMNKVVLFTLGPVSTQHTREILNTEYEHCILPIDTRDCLVNDFRMGWMLINEYYFQKDLVYLSI